MSPNNHSPCYSFSFFSIILHLTFFRLIFSSSTYAYNDKRYDNCAPVNSSTCGFHQEITYPFWKPNDLPDYCGHPDFKLDCQGNTLVIEIVNQTFSVLDINYTAKSLTLLKPQFSSDDPCPRITPSQLTNTTLDLTLFNFTSGSQNATLLYDCINSKHEKSMPYNFTCASIDHPEPGYSTPFFKHGLGFFVLDEKSEDEVKKDCGLEVYVPVLRTEVLRLFNGSSTIHGVLNKGFEVNWMIETSSCKDCLDSGGRCGYNSTLNETVCFCQDGAYSTNCHESSHRLDQTSTLISTKHTPRTAIFIGAGVAAASSIILMCILGFLYTQRHKWQHRSLLPAYIAKSKASTFSGSYSSSPSDLQSLNGSSYFGVQLFSYRELERATDFFSPSKELGEGGFGTVYHAKLGDGREVAIKRLYENNNKRAQQFMNEVEILAHLRHKNLVTLYGCTSRQSRELLLVYEYVRNGTVADHLHGSKAKSESLTWPTRLNIAMETASALLYLHASDIIHRDVKTQNILLDKDFSVKVADFGLSRLFPLDVTHVSTAPQGTPGYVDPEYYQCYQLTEKSDVYSFGVVLAELISSKPAVDITRRKQEINLSNMATDKIQNNALHEFVDPSLGFETDFKVKKEIAAVAELAFRCLQGAREMRPSMEEVLETLRGVKDNQNKVDKAEVVDISEDDMYMLKSDLSPGSTQMGDNSARGHILQASI